ncbi:CDP-glycerol glycerophosphotransferase family protein [Nocardioides sp. TRM66260-LWL]|uniref:CDP-glycerol glycerophosphotransferase family protein n=1 Tax=Nocardioides sp. TRM66260-LWL TaxID=2874478 RepID=UPI001CC4ACB9|nr:CDP-glycerol glycerophosphotransferase family protein [Nocardioides sp. TRM66260-LWL]MBZ5734050.1 CDP-glycerol glycerophosphotransferase family protein [Nocardioides sp. TRM66260-LWL]
MNDVAVIAYFADDPSRLYQLQQWVPVLEVLDRSAPVALVLRDPDSAAQLRERTALPVLVAPSFPELTALYAGLDAGVALYCNNSMLNFQSLLDSRLLHVHINHGESDKGSMASNNAKAYDRVLVAGEAAVQRYVEQLLELDATRLVRIGRPQLDLREEPILAPSPRRTVLYAPTWEGDADYNNYSSLDTLGVDVVEAVLAQRDVRLVYKPHPKIVTSATPAIRDAHRAVTALVEDAARRDPDAGHRAIPVGDILRVMPRCDAIVTDVSSVGLDWLYLRTDAPLLITDRHHDAERLRAEVPVSRCADVITTDDRDRLAALLAARLDHDEHHLARVAMRHHYFDDVAVGESTTRFVDVVVGLVEHRDRLLGHERRSPLTRPRGSAAPA